MFYRNDFYFTLQNLQSDISTTINSQILQDLTQGNMNVYLGISDNDYIAASHDLLETHNMTFKVARVIV